MSELTRRSVLSFVVGKLLHLVGVLGGVLLITFGLMHAIPGTPWNNFAGGERALANQNMDAVTINALNRRFGLELPLWRQFTRYAIGDWDERGIFFCGVVCGNLGPSLTQRGRSVQSVLFDPPRGLGFWESRIGYSLRLVLLGALVAAGLGIPLGILSALRPAGLSSRILSLGLAGLMSIPSFILGLLAVIVLASWLKLILVLPDWKLPGHWVVPALVLAAAPMASLARVTRAAIVVVMGEPYIRAARARGVSRARVVLVHGLRNALGAVITYLGPLVIEMFAGLFVVENLYSFPGIGREFWNSVLELDYSMILGLALVYAVGITLVNVLIELLVEALDPRIRANRTGGAR